MEISQKLKVGYHSVGYWLQKYCIRKRIISEAIYQKHNPDGDPFSIKEPSSKYDFVLWGIGVGLYWGEGNKLNKNTVKIGNSDPNVLRIFMKFLVRFFQIDRNKLKFHLHTFTDIDINQAKQYWMKELNIKEEQFYKPFVSKTGSLGTYRKKSKFGVLTLYYGNTKIRNLLVNAIAEIAQSEEHTHGKRKVPGSIPGLGSL